MSVEEMVEGMLNELGSAGMEVLPAVRVEDIDRFTFGSEIPRDVYNVVLAARTSKHPDLPVGNYNYEATIDSVIQEQSVTKINASHAHEVLRRLEVTKYNDGSFTSSITLWQILSGKPGKDWKEKSFEPATKYQALVEKTIRTMETRLNKSLAGGDSSISRSETISRAESSPPESKRKRSSLEDGGLGNSAEAEDFASLLKSVRSCQTIKDFIEMYESGIVYHCLNRIRSAFRDSTEGVEEWAKEWAQLLYEGDETADNLHRDRKLTLELLYTLLNRWKGKNGPKTLTAENVVNDFEKKRIMEILKLCLPMDRACALYRHTLAGETRPGTHWVSEIHVKRDPEWAERMRSYDGSPSMNKRYLWLMEEEDLVGLGLRDSNFMRKYTTPVISPTEASE